MRKIYSLLFSCLVSSFLFAQTTLAGWDVSTMPGGSNNFGPSPLAATTSQPALTVGGLTRGSGVSTPGTGAAEGWGGTAWNNATAAANIAANKFITFTVTANTGNAVSFSSINPFDYRRSGTGATSALIQYSIGAGTFTDITTVSLSSPSANGASAGPIALSGITALQNVAPGVTVTFRIVPFNASGAAGTFYIYNVGNSAGLDLTVNGILTPQGTLPVKFSNLKATQTSRGINLQWSNMTESDVVDYTLERSSNGRNFTSVAQFNPSANNGGKADYQYMDASPLSGTSFYRIKAVETNGKTTYSDLARISIGGRNTLLNLYPNPVKGNALGLQIDNLPAGKYSIRIYNGSAQAVTNQSLNHEGGSVSQTIPLNNLKAGVYTFEISGVIKLQKQFIIE